MKNIAKLVHCCLGCEKCLMLSNNLGTVQYKLSKIEVMAMGMPSVSYIDRRVITSSQ